MTNRIQKPLTRADTIGYYVNRIALYSAQLGLTADQSGLAAALEIKDERKLQARLMYISNELAKRIDGEIES